MTADIEPYTKTDSGQDTELPGLVMMVALVAILMALVLLFS